MPRGKKAQPESIIQPLVKDTHSPHPFEEAEKSGELPELTSIGFVRIGTTNNFVSYVIKSKGAEVLSVEVSDPNLRAIAEETSKIDFVQNFLDAEHGELMKVAAP